jgi:hypothetical protein
MLGDFDYCNPTRLHFGPDAMDKLAGELASYGKRVALVYGGGSIKKNGVYEQVMAALRAADKDVAEIAGVMPNPTRAKLDEGVAVARDFRADFILAVGGGSVCDYAKALAVSIHADGDPWEKYYVRFEEPDCDIVPVGCVLTMVGTGSEMNAGSVITDTDSKMKVGHVFADPAVMPRFSILNPEFTLSLPHRQMVAGVYDIFNHICEQYFSGVDDNVSDYLAEGLMRSVVAASRVANANDQDYEARSNLMWAATWALNTLIGKGKSQDWMVHMLGQAVGAHTDATHGMTLSAVSGAYYRAVMPYGLPKFARFARTVWDVDPAGKAEKDVALEGIEAMEAWMRELGLATNLTELGVTPDMVEAIADSVIICKGGYKDFTRADVVDVLNKSL